MTRLSSNEDHSLRNNWPEFFSKKVLGMSRQIRAQEVFEITSTHTSAKGP
jgi:DNA mismatch repair protein MutH